MNLTKESLPLRKADEKTKDGNSYTKDDLRLISSLSSMLYFDEEDETLYIITDSTINCYSSI